MQIIENAVYMGAATPGQGGGGTPEIYRVFRNDNGTLKNSITTPFIPLPSSVTDISNYMLARCYSGTPSSVLSGAIDLSSLTTISGDYACYSMFNACSGITSIDLSSLTTVSGASACSRMFEGCSALTSVDLSSLGSITGNNGCEYLFSACTNLTNVVFTSLVSMSGKNALMYAFYGTNNITSISFPALKSTSVIDSTALLGLVYGVTGCTIHFPSNLDPQSGSTKISSLTGYPNFDGINTVLAFDLPATE